MLKSGILLIFYLPLFQSQGFKHINAVVNEPKGLSCAIECYGDAKWTTFIPSTADLAHCSKEECRVEERFQNRFSISRDRTRGSISLLIQSVTFNDKGSYRCSCDGKTAEIKLKVFVPMVVTAGKLEKVSLPCYGDTRRDAKDVQWKKDEQQILLYNHKNRNGNTVEGLEDRFTLSPEAFKDGDLSLHIASVQQSDAGLYFCSIHDESVEGEPRAVLLKVEEPSKSRCVGAVIVLAVLSVALATVVGLLLTDRTYPQSEPPDTRGSLDGRASTNPPHPVQEQRDPMLDKASSTTPF